MIFKGFSWPEGMGSGVTVFGWVHTPDPHHRPDAAAQETASYVVCTWVANFSPLQPSEHSCQPCRPPNCGAVHTLLPASNTRENWITILFYWVVIIIGFVNIYHINFVNRQWKLLDIRRHTLVCLSLVERASSLMRGRKGSRKMTGFISANGTAKLSLLSESQATNFFIISSDETSKCEHKGLRSTTQQISLLTVKCSQSVTLEKKQHPKCYCII